MRWHRVSISCWPRGSDPSMGWEWGHSSTTAYSRAWCAAVLIACTSLLARGCFGAVLGVNGAEWGCSTALPRRLRCSQGSDRGFIASRWV